MKKRMLSALLCAVLLCTSLPAFSVAAAPSTGEDYDRLYAENGLTVSLAATPDALGDVNLAAGTWRNRQGGGNILLRSGGSVQWQEMNGGIGYRMTKAQWKEDGGQGRNYIDLGIGNLPEDYTVETVSVWTGLTDAEGHPHIDSEDHWGVYTANYSAFELGRRHGTGFVCESTLPTGTSYSVRESYHTAPWGGHNGSYQFSAFSVAAEEMRTVPVSTVFTGQSGNYSGTNDVIFDEAGNRIEGATSRLSGRGYQFITYINGSKADDFNTVTSDVGGKYPCTYSKGGRTYQDGFQKRLPPEKSFLTGGNFILMRNFPGTVYTVRVYNRVLTESEKMQNRFADRCRISGINVSGFQGLSPADKTAVYQLTDGLPYLMNQKDREKAQDIVDFYTGKNMNMAYHALSYRGMQAKLKGEAGVRALFRIENRMLEILENKYTVRIGAICALGERDGETVLTPQDLTVRDTGSGFLPAYGKAFTVYSTKDDYGATGKYTESQVEYREFAYTVYFGEGGDDSDAYRLGLVYRGFVALTDQSGNTTVFYVNAEGDTFGASTALYGETTSLLDVADFLVNRYSGVYLKEKEWNSNSLLRKVLGDCGETVTDFHPGRQAEEYREIFVDPDFRGTENGTETEPYTSVEQAMTQAKQYYRSLPSVSVVLHLKDGVHRITSPLALTKTDMVGNSFFTLMGEGNATLTGNMPLEGSWQQVPGEAYYKMQLPLESDGLYPNFRYLYVNGELADLAYFGYKRYRTATDEGGKYFSTGTSVPNSTKDAMGKVYCDPNNFRGLSDSDLEGAEFHMACQWEFRIFHIDHIDRNDKKSGKVAVYLKEFTNGEGTGNCKFDNRYFWLENRLAFLDSPGEYFYDKNTGLLYYYPKGNILSDRFEIPGVEQLFRMQDVKNITLDGVTLTGCDNLLLDTLGYYTAMQAGHMTVKGMDYSPEQAVFYGKNMENATFTDVHIQNVSGDGITLLGALDKIDVVGCTFREIGRTALRMGAANSYSAGNHIKDARVHNNLVEGAAWFHRDTVGMYFSVGKNIEITHNTVRNCSYTAISIGWKWNSTTLDPQDGYCNLYNVDIGWNRLEDFMTDMSDGGGIYTLGGNANVDTYKNQYFNFLHDNYAIVNKYTGAGKGFFMPLYHDGASSNWYDSGNVVEDYPGNHGLGSFYVQIGSADLATQQAHNVLLEDNYFLYGENRIQDPVKISGTTYRCKSEAEYMEKVVFWNHLRPQFDTKEQNNHLVQINAQKPARCQKVMNEAGILQK